jgi:hypothetical protein
MLLQLPLRKICIASRCAHCIFRRNARELRTRRKTNVHALARNTIRKHAPRMASVRIRGCLPFACVRAPCSSFPSRRRGRSACHLRAARQPCRRWISPVTAAQLSPARVCTSSICSSHAGSAAGLSWARLRRTGLPRRSAKLCAAPVRCGTEPLSDNSRRTGRAPAHDVSVGPLSTAQSVCSTARKCGWPSSRQLAAKPSGRILHGPGKRSAS